jgi:CheY-like chemotaxis protein
MNGKEAYDELIKHCPDIKVIFMSGYTKDIIEQEGLQTEGSSLLSKPLNPTVLLRKIREVLEIS